MKDKKQTYVVIAQDWIEYERGWGCRPDGCSLHLSELDRVKFCGAYWARMPKSAPDEYSKESGTPYLMVVTEELYQEIVMAKGKYGVWSHGRSEGIVRKATLDELVG